MSLPLHDFSDKSVFSLFRVRDGRLIASRGDVNGLFEDYRAWSRTKSLFLSDKMIHMEHTRLSQCNHSAFNSVNELDALALIWSACSYLGRLCSHDYIPHGSIFHLNSHSNQFSKTRLTIRRHRGRNAKDIESTRIFKQKVNIWLERQFSRKSKSKIVSLRSYVSSLAKVWTIKIRGAFSSIIARRNADRGRNNWRLKIHKRIRNACRRGKAEQTSSL